MLFEIKYKDGEQDQVSIKLDRQDTWSVDHTLAPLIVALLKQLKEHDVGWGLVEDWDVPAYLLNGSDADGWPVNAKERWGWLLDELIWAFSIHQDWEHDLQFIDEPDKMTEFVKRKRKAFLLFGKYYENLWE